MVVAIAVVLPPSQESDMDCEVNLVSLARNILI